jgi:hypothetical protein
MIEAIYKALRIELPTPELPQEIDRLMTSARGEPDLVSFIKKRISPMFSKPSLGAIVGDLRKRYAQLTLTRILDERWIGKLRNKEAHGTTERYSGRDYRYMVAVRDLLATIYPCLILEACGMSQDVILKHLIDAPYEYSRFFNDKHTTSIEAELLDEQV